MSTAEERPVQQCRVDAQVHPSMKVYSAGNFGEIAPERLSPMSWSLVGRPMELGTRHFVGSILGYPRWASGSHYVFTGYFNCRPYHNLTAYCAIAEKVDFVTPRDVTAAYFEGIDPPSGSGGRGSGRVRRNSATWKMLSQLVSLRPQVVELEQDVFAFEQDVNDVVAAGDDWRIGELAAAGNSLLERAWHLHIISTSGSIAAEVMQRTVLGTLVNRADSLSNWLKEPGELPWGRLFGLSSFESGPAEFVDKAFYEIADQSQPWADYAARPVGHQVSRARDVVDVSPREALVGMRGAVRGRAIDASVLFLGDVMALREHSKSLAMRLLHTHRKFVPRLANVRKVADEDWPYLTMAELRGRVPSSSEIELRRESCAEALALEMPDYLDFGPGASREHQPKRVARGVSAGVFDGPALGIDGTPEQAGSVLVCESADANIMPLLPFVGAVVTARGSQYSHVAIICRELGIPAVVSHPLASQIKPGQRVQVNGNSGEVRILD